MLGVLIIAAVLLVVMPIGIIMSGTIFAALLGTTTKNSVDNAHEDTELLALSESNPYADS